MNSFSIMLICPNGKQEAIRCGDVKGMALHPLSLFMFNCMREVVLKCSFSVVICTRENLVICLQHFLLLLVVTNIVGKAMWQSTLQGPIQSGWSAEEDCLSEWAFTFLLNLQADCNRNVHTLGHA